MITVRPSRPRRGPQPPECGAEYASSAQGNLVDKPAEAAEAQVLVGRISGIFGVKGWVRIYSYTDPPENILGYGPWLVGDGQQGEYAVLDGAMHGRGIIARLAGIDDRDRARALIGSAIRVPRGRFGRTAEGEYYCSDLIGLRVCDRDGRELGRVEDIMDTGANDVLVVRGERRRLVPFLATVVKTVDLAAGTMEVDWDADF
ncbi:Ribosome maturation factor RimM [Gammaproteobacteria bacterium]|nr:Ribosome maturation factor RimM [Gammaproteobacteria bacterium]